MATELTSLAVGVDSSGFEALNRRMEEMVSIAGRVENSAARITSATERMSATQERAASATDNLTGSIAKGAAAGIAIEKMIERTIGLTVDLATGFVRLGFSVGEYQDIADRTMADPGGLASMQVAADVAGTSISSVSTTLRMMERQMSRTSDESDRGARALKAIGLNFKEFEQLSPDQKMRAVAVALQGFADTGEKVAVIEDIMGRGASQNLGFLKELASGAEDVGIALDTKMIAASDRAGDSIKRQQSELLQLAKVMAVPTTEAVEGLHSVLNDTVRSMLGLETEADRLAGQKAVREFAWDLAEGFAFAADQIDLFVRLFVTGAKTAAAAAAQFKALLFSSPSTLIRNVTTIGAEWQADMNQIWSRKTFGQQVEDRRAKADARFLYEGYEGYDDYSSRPAGARINYKSAEPDKPKKDKEAERQAREAQRSAELYQRLMSSSADMVAQLQAEYDSEQKLTAVDQLRVRVMEQINRGYLGTNLRRIDSVLLMVNEAAGLEALAEAEKRNLEWLKKSGDENARKVEAQQRAADSARTTATRLAEENELLGLNADQIAEVLNQRIIDTASRKESVAAILEQTIGVTEYTQALRDEAAALRDQAKERQRKGDYEKRRQRDPAMGVQSAIDKYVEEAGNLGDAFGRLATDGIKKAEDALVEFATTGKTDIKSLINTMIAEFLRLQVIRPMLAQLLSPLGSGGGGYGGILSGLFGSLLGGASGAGSMGFDYSLPTAGVRLGKAAGGTVEPFADLIVGENGPERIKMGPERGTVVPNNLLAGKPSVSLNYSPTIKVDARSDAAVVAQVAASVTAEGNRRLVAELKAMGVI